MKKTNTVLWGIVLIAVGVLWALNAFEILTFDIFFDGWWTLFIIVPSAIGLVTERDKSGNLLGIAIGVGLLLCCQNIIDFSMFWKLLIPAVIVIAGLKLVLSGFSGKNKAGIIIKVKKESGETLESGCAVFSANEINYNGRVFDGAELTAVFGGVDCDLRKAIIEKDCAIRATAVFGGIEILVPEGVNVRVSPVSIFGGVSNKTASRSDVPTVYITATCIFGGVDVA